MKVFDSETNVVGLARTAGSIMDTVPRLMGRIRRLMHHDFPEGVGMPQYRALGYLARRGGGVSLTELAEHQGLLMASASKLVESLVQLGYVTRITAEDDRRRVEIAPTAAGIAALQKIRVATQGRLAEFLEGMAPHDQDVVIAAMTILQRTMDSGRSRHHRRVDVREEQ